MCQTKNRRKIQKTFIMAFKVIAFSANQKPVQDFLLVINGNLSPISHRFWDTATYCLKVANILHFLSFSAFAGGVSPFEFMEKLYGSWN